MDNLAFQTETPVELGEAAVESKNIFDYYAFKSNSVQMVLL